MTLDQAFPGLANTPGGVMIAVADTLFDITGPANEMQAEVLRRTSAHLQAEIKRIDPHWHYDSLGPITTVDGLGSEVNDLRFERAAVIARVRGDGERTIVRSLHIAYLTRVSEMWLLT